MTAKHEPDLLDRLADGASFEELLEEGMISDKEYTEIMRSQKKEIKTKKLSLQAASVRLTMPEEPKLVGLMFQYYVITCNFCRLSKRHLSNVYYKTQRGTLTQFTPFTVWTPELSALREQGLFAEEETTVIVAMCHNCLGN